MKKFLIDTNIYIDFLRRGAYREIISNLYAYETPGIYFSSVVIQELLIGATGKEGRKNVETLYRSFESIGRIGTPTHNNWKEAGNLLSLLRIRRKDLKTKIPALINDTLIALSAFFRIDCYAIRTNLAKKRLPCPKRTNQATKCAFLCQNRQ